MSSVRGGRRRQRMPLHQAWAPLLALALLSGARAMAESAPGSGLELDLRDVPLVTAINMLIAQSGAEISFVDPDAKLQSRKVVFLSIKPKSVEDALQKICRATGCYFEKEPGGEYVISPEPLATAKPAQPDMAPSSSPEAVDSLPRSEEITKIRLQFTDPTMVKAMLENSTLASKNRIVPNGPGVLRDLHELDVIPGTFDGTTGDYTAPPTFAQPAGRPLDGTGAGQFLGGFGGVAPGGVGGVGGAPGGTGC